MAVRPHGRQDPGQTRWECDPLDGAIVVAMLGLTFKADTDDLRDSPSMLICQRLLDAGATVRAFDPAAGEAAADLSRARRAP